jgi:dipeptidyl aminopeptidase/acylaminoacyl peptidase
MRHWTHACSRTVRWAVHAVLAAALMTSVMSAQETLVQRLLRIAGLTAAPSQLRGPGDDSQPGNLWIADLRLGTTRPLTTDGGYRSPVFAPDGTVFALKNSAIVKIAAGGGVSVVQHAAGIAKLVGVNREDADEMIVLMETTGSAPLSSVSLARGTIVALPFDPQSEAERRMIAQIRAQDRVYGETTIYTRSEVKRGLSRNIEWTDVYVKRGSAAPVNTSRCDGVNCGQPALSPDGQSAVFVRIDD